MRRGGGGVGALWLRIVSHTCRGHVTSAARDCEQLNIAWNMIGDSGFIELADALQYNKKLQQVDLCPAVLAVRVRIIL